MAWIRAVDETDPKLQIVELNGKDVDYLVRTGELTCGKSNVFEIYLDGQKNERLPISLDSFGYPKISETRQLSVL